MIVRLKRMRLFRSETVKLVYKVLLVRGWGPSIHTCYQTLYSY